MHVWTMFATFLSLVHAGPTRGLGQAEGVPGLGGVCGYRALLFAVQDYDHRGIPDLGTPKSDIQALGEVLKRRYGFAVERHHDPTRAQLLDRLLELHDEVEACDAVVVYFAGHGILDDKLSTGFWLGRDADPKSNTTWISNDDVARRLVTLKARHVALVVDSCFGGALITRETRGLRRAGTAVAPRDVQELLGRSSRWVITSGGEELVVDDFQDRGTSVFAHFLLQELESAKGPWVGLDSLFPPIRQLVGANSDQVPVQGPLKGHLGGALVLQVEGAEPPKAEPAPRHPEPGVRTRGASSVEMVELAGGAFVMGSPTTEPGREAGERQHVVELDRFAIMTTEVTQELWTEVMGPSSNPSRHPDCGERCPVDSVSWAEAIGFANALSERDGLRPVYVVSGTRVRANTSANGYRLPTEAEWEYAARGGETGQRYAGGHAADAVGWTRGSGGPRPACGKPQNGFGLCDMTGNVAEWVFDGWSAAYPTQPVTNPVVEPRPDELARVVRGGHWNSRGPYARVAARDFMDADQRRGWIGFRLARSP